MEYISFWLAKVAVDVAIFIVGMIVLFSWALFPYLARMRKQRKCPHEYVHETQACDAICTQCGKNLGFIQHWRDARKAKSGLGPPSKDEVTKNYVDKQS